MTFREDLFYRLNAAHIHLPPLRERPEDLKPLSQYFLNCLGYPNPEHAIDAGLLARLAVRTWPGNIREFRNAVEHAAVVARGRRLLESDFPPSDQALRELPATGAQDLPAIQGTEFEAALQQLIQNLLTDDATALHERFLQHVEPVLLKMVMQHMGNNKARAAEILGIHRGTLRERLRQYGLEESDGA